MKLFLLGMVSLYFGLNLIITIWVLITELPIALKSGITPSGILVALLIILFFSSAIVFIEGFKRMYVF